MSVGFCQHDCEDVKNVCPVCQLSAELDRYMNLLHEGNLMGMTESKSGIPAEGRKDDKEKIQLQYLGRIETWMDVSKLPPETAKLLHLLDEFWFSNDITSLEDSLEIILEHTSLEDLIEVRKFGAKKYGLLNYRAGMEWSRLFGSARRHLYYYPFVRNEIIDPEHGKNHLCGAYCSIAFLYEYVNEKLGKDDRRYEVS